MLFPAGNGRYHTLRPTLALQPTEGQPFSEDARLRWHPSLAPLAELHAEGKVTVLPAVGYTNADQSHFTSRHYWEVGATDAHLRTGWLGRYLDVAGALDNPLQGLALSGSLHPALASANVPVACVSRIDDYDFWASGVWGPVQQRMLDALGTFPPGSSPATAKVAEVATQVARLRGQLLPFDGGNWGSPVAYPTGRNAFPARLAGLAAIIAAGLPLRCVSITAPGMYDTHSDQAGELTNSLALTANTLRAFQRDLEARGIADRVLVHVWSEFGRRGEENGSRHRPRRRRHRAPDRLPRARPDARRVPRARDRPRRRREPDGDLRLPLALLLAPRAVVRDRRRRSHPERGGLPAGGAPPMTRRPDLATVLLLALLAALALVLVPRSEAAPASRAVPTRVQVTSTEFRLTMSRVVVPGGRVRIELVNLGEDPHDLKLRRIGGKYTYTIPETHPGERSTKTLRLIRGPLPGLVRDRRAPGLGHARDAARRPAALAVTRPGKNRAPFPVLGSAALRGAGDAARRQDQDRSPAATASIKASPARSLQLDGSES